MNVFIFEINLDDGFVCMFGDALAASCADPVDVPDLSAGSTNNMMVEDADLRYEEGYFTYLDCKYGRIVGGTGAVLLPENSKAAETARKACRTAGKEPGF